MLAFSRRKPSAPFWVVSTLILVAVLGWLLPPSQLTSKIMFAVGILGGYLALDAAKRGHKV